MENRIKEEYDILRAKIEEIDFEIIKLNGTRTSAIKHLNQLRDDIYLLCQDSEAYFLKYGNERTY